MLLVTRTLDMNVTVTFNHPTFLYFPTVINRVLVLCNADGGLGCWWVLPADGIAVEI